LSSLVTVAVSGWPRVTRTSKAEPTSSRVTPAVLSCLEAVLPEALRPGPMLPHPARVRAATQTTRSPALAERLIERLHATASRSAGSVRPLPDRMGSGEAGRHLDMMA
jgi:hypothetical protein